MSTRFTKRGVPLVESQSLQLIQSASRLNDVITKYLSQRLVEKGYASLTPSLLSFLSILECGVNYGSEIARNLGVTRQMVAKTVKELCHLGYLEQIDSTGKQKEIHFTETGEYLMSDARQLLAEVDEILFKDVDARTPQAIIRELNIMICAVNDRRHI
ncbi:MarR family winged helix-turn-helix transcriptional regulator [Methylotuvimicrobium sp. KM1]|uniref:MarR family winged helix-turn-helix transcriptional regulator n=1 Tax=Methylotuvimicrobium sp. KM1 TaxID=3377707 RepID=UPI00384AB7AD